jgi:hypothetical protein
MIVLNKMYEMVGASPDGVDFKSSGWYLEHEWDKATEESFTKWLGDYLYSNKSARQEIMSWPVKNKALCHRAAKWFVFSYGFKTKLCQH